MKRQRNTTQMKEIKNYTYELGTKLTKAQTGKLELKTQHWCYPTTSSTLCRMPHLNNKQNKNTNQIISRQEYHLTQPCPSEEK